MKMIESKSIFQSLRSPLVLVFAFSDFINAATNRLLSFYCVIHSSVSPIYI